MNVLMEFATKASSISILIKVPLNTSYMFLWYCIIRTIIKEGQINNLIWLSMHVSYMKTNF